MSEINDFGQGVSADLLVEGKPIAGSVDGKPIVVVRHASGLSALAGKCTHLGAPLEKGLICDGELRCPWHHARFSLATGEAVGAPAFEPLARYMVVEEDHTVRVTSEQDPVPAIEAAPSIGRIVIVGGGAAGHACAEMLARHGAGASVTLLSSDADAPYDRTLCSKQYLAGKKTRDEAMLPEPGLGRGTKPTIRLGCEISAIDTHNRSVTLADGETIAFDKLILATGAEPVVPDFTGSDRDDAYVVRTLVDTDALIEHAGYARRAIVLGSSYIGLEVAASLTGRGLSVTVVADGEIPLEKTAGSEIGKFIRSLHEDKGVVFHMGREVTQWDGSAATLDDGTVIEGDLLVMGTGVQPRIALCEAAGLTIAGKEEGGGVAVDGQLQTSSGGIYAIGDIASVPDPRLAHKIRVEHWVVAQRMGQWLARHLLGVVEGDYHDTPFFWSGHYGTSLRYVGHVASPDDQDIDGEVTAGDFTATFREDGQEQAVMTCGRDLAALKAEAAMDQRA